MKAMGVPGLEDKRDLDERDFRILGATEELVAEQGYDRVRLIDIADRSGVSVGSLQHRYRTREGLLRAVVERVATFELPSFLEVASRVDDPFDRLVALLEHSFFLLNPKQPSTLLWFELVIVSARNEELREILSNSDADWRKAFRDTFEEGFATDRFHSDLDAEQLGTVLIAIIDGFSVQRILDRGISEPKQQAELAITVLSNLVQVEDRPR